MTKKIKVVSIVMFLFAVLSISACGGSDKSKFVGSWKWLDSQGYPTTITFNADGNWTRHIESYLTPKGLDYTGKYSIDEKEKTVTINIDPLPDDRLRFTTEVFYHYTLDGDTLTLAGRFDTTDTAKKYTRV